MNRTSLFFAALLAASFAVPSRTRETLPAAQAGIVSASHASAASSVQPEALTSDLRDEAHSFFNVFLSKANAFPLTDKEKPGLKVLFATLADPVQTHLAAAFDHDLAALQDGAQDSDYLLDSWWIPWEIPRSYDSLDDKVKEEELVKARHSYPGILLFRSVKPGENPYANGLIVFLLAEKPTTGIDIDQAKIALQILAWVAQQQTNTSTTGGSHSSPSGDLPVWTFPDHTALILGPSYSGSLDSLVALVNEIRYSSGIEPPSKFLIRSSDFTSSGDASCTAQTIAKQFNVQIDMGSAAYPFDRWIDLALTTLNTSGISSDRVAVLSEGESLYGYSEQSSKKRTSSSPVPQDSQLCKDSTAPTQDPQPWSLEFPKDISALRSTYEQQGVLDNSSLSETLKPSLRIGSAEGKNGDAIRVFGGEETVAAQESVLFGISEFLRSHGIHAIIIVATNEEDSYFLTRFYHVNNTGVRVVIIGPSRLFTRGSTAQFRGDMMVGSFPLLPKLYDWTAPIIKDDPAHDHAASNPAGDFEHGQTDHIFSNDASEGEYIAARDLLWQDDADVPPLPREYSSPGWDFDGEALRPPLYISALGDGTVWPISETDLNPEEDPTPGSGVQQSSSATNQPPASSNTSDPSVDDWRLSMPFRFAVHPFESKTTPYGTGLHIGVQNFGPGGFWRFTFYLCTSFSAFFCFGVVYSDPLRRRRFAYLQPATKGHQWIFLLTMPALLSESAYLIIARQVSYPVVNPFVANAFSDVGHWWFAALAASLVVPLFIVWINWWKGSRPGGFLAGPPKEETAHAKVIFASTIGAIGACFAILLAADLRSSRQLSEVLNTYREMHWESGLSLVPTILLMVFAMAVWNYGALVGISVLSSCPLLPEFPDYKQISETRGKQIANIGMPFPIGKAARRYWISTWLVTGAVILILMLWPSFRAITSLSSKTETCFVFGLAVAASIFMLMDILQFTWLWGKLRNLLRALGRREFKRSFVPLRDFNWKNIWTFSAGSFQERSKVLAAQAECALVMEAQGSNLVSREAGNHLEKVIKRYSKLNFENVNLETYRNDLEETYKCFAKIGTKIADAYSTMLRRARIMPLPQLEPCDNDPFRNEEREAKQLPEELRLCESFLCLLYIGFIQAIIARLRSLAISIVSVFSLIALGVAIYPFQPTQPLFVIGAAVLVVIGVVIFVVFSQMEKDPILARILDTDPNKLEWSFYSKYIDALALPLLTLLSSLLPGGAGRIIDLLRNAFNHGQ